MAAWEESSLSRDVNNALNEDYFLHNLELNKKNSFKTWKLINELSSGKSCISRSITEIKTDNETINSAPEIAGVLTTFTHLLDQI